ncbi:hypothetical protein P9D25_14840 [Bacillus velezensis]|uniref:hypothetical protein n=1 Tax=Bacillus velezensis TaxID=492670 RepID=UPI002DB78F35|nr:hypothetical protein [Bacillus velezensis]MEC1338926.1 hypothetical protein [Bacillus velezensis]
MSNQNFRETEIAENLSHIKVLTNYKTEYSRQTSPYFIIWGCIWIIAYSVSLCKVPSVVLACVWFILAIVGWILTLKTYLKQKQFDPMPTFLKNQLKYAWIGFSFMVFIFVFLILMGLLPRTGEFLSFLIVLMVSIKYIFLGIVLTKEIFVMGFWLSILGMLTFCLFPEAMNIVFAFIGGGSLLLTGMILKRKGQGNE